VLVVLEGNFEKEQPSTQQIRALNELSLWLAVTWKIPASKIKGHRDYAATACPGKKLESELLRLRKNIAANTKE
jgi:N-acetyl-anhydromuramyl-L-alanine amidase AmpD